MPTIPRVRPGEMPATRWSMVLEATEPVGPAREALEALVQSYWYPAYAFVRRLGRSHEDAQDLTQGFFARLLEKRDWRVAPERGRFRSFLLTALRHYIANEHRKESAVRLGADRLASIDAQADQRYELEAPPGLSPERLFEKRFALQLIDGCLAVLAEEQTQAGRGRQFAALAPHLSGAEHSRGYGEVAAQLGSSEGAVRVAVHRLRRRLRELIRRAVADVVESPQELEGELRALFDVLAD